MALDDLLTPEQFTAKVEAHFTRCVIPTPYTDRVLRDVKAEIAAGTFSRRYWRLTCENRAFNESMGL